jgi:hypothetical protein
MPGLLDLLGDPLSNLTKGIGDIIGKFVTDPNQKLQASMDVAKLQEQFQEKLVDADIAFANAQRDVIVAEAKSESWMARNWRPMIMLMFGYIIFHNFIIAQLFSLKTLPVPDDLWALMKLGIGGYVIGRSAEKIVPEVTKAIVANKKDQGEN